MGNVIGINSRRRDPHKSGEVRCMGCGHRWIGVAPVSTCFIECPECLAIKGTFLHAVKPLGAIMRCDCGNDLFFVGPFGPECPNCGECHAFPEPP